MPFSAFAAFSAFADFSALAGFSALIDFSALAGFSALIDFSTSAGLSLGVFVLAVFCFSILSVFCFSILAGVDVVSASAGCSVVASIFGAFDGAAEDLFATGRFTVRGCRGSASWT